MSYTRDRGRRLISNRSLKTCRWLLSRYNSPCLGEVPEWTNGAVSKTAVVLVATVGSNPTLSAWGCLLEAAPVPIPLAIENSWKSSLHALLCGRVAEL